MELQSFCLGVVEAQKALGAVAVLQWATVRRGSKMAVGVAGDRGVESRWVSDEAPPVAGDGGRRWEGAWAPGSRGCGSAGGWFSDVDTGQQVTDLVSMLYRVEEDGFGFA